MEARLKAVKTLGEADEDEDGDMAAWVEKNRWGREGEGEGEKARSGCSDAQWSARGGGVSCLYNMQGKLGRF